MANFKELANYIRTRIKGKEVRESLAQAVEAAGEVNEEQKALKETFNNLVINAGNSNAEVVVARGKSKTLGERLNNVDSQIDEIENLNIESKLDYYKRIELQHPSGCTYSSFGSGVNIDGKEIYVVRGAKSHITDSDKSKWGKLYFYIRESKSRFSIKEIETDYDLDFRDTNLSLTRDKKYIYLSTFMADLESNHGSIVMLFDIELNKIAENIIIDINNNIKDLVVWGNTLETPDGFLLKTAFSTKEYGIYLIKSKAKINYDDFSNIEWESPIKLQYTLNKYIAEPCAFYLNNKLCIIARWNEKTENYIGTPFCYSYDLEGKGDFSSLDFQITKEMIHSPAVEPYVYNSNFVNIAGSWEKSDTLRVPAIFRIYDNFSISDIKTIDSDAKYIGGYPSLVPNLYGYGIMYYGNDNPNNNGELNSLYFKDINFNDYFNDELKKINIQNIESELSTITLTNNEYQKINIIKNTIIKLPQVEEFTQIHLLYSSQGDFTIDFPEVKYINNLNREVNSSNFYEIILTFDGSVWTGSNTIYTKNEYYNSITYLYKEGEEYVNMTGGWIDSFFCINEDKGTASKNNNSMYLKAIGAVTKRSYITTKKISLNGYTKLKLKCNNYFYASGEDANRCISLSVNSINEKITVLPNNTFTYYLARNYYTNNSSNILEEDKVIEILLDGTINEGYICVCVDNWAKTLDDSYTELIVKDIWLE